MSILFSLTLPEIFDTTSIDWVNLLKTEVTVKEVGEREFEISVTDDLEAHFIDWQKLFGTDCVVKKYTREAWNMSGWTWQVIAEPKVDREFIDIDFDDISLEGHDEWWADHLKKEEDLSEKFYGRKNVQGGDFRIVDITEISGDLPDIQSCSESGDGRFFIQCKSNETYLYDHLIIPLANELKYDKPLVVIDYPLIPYRLPDNPLVILRLDAEQLTIDSLRGLIRCDTQDPLAKFITEKNGPLIIHLRNIHNAKEQINGLVRCLVDCHFGSTNRSASTVVFLTGIYPHCRGSLALDPGVSGRCKMWGILV